MKKVIQDLARTFNLESGYAGISRTLYVKGERGNEFRRVVRERYPSLAFEIKVCETIPVSTDIYDAETNSSGKIEVVGSPVYVESENVTLQTAIIDLNPIREASKDEVDAYLLTNPIDRKAKNPYGAAAEALGRSKDYIRDRYRKLRDKNLVEA